MEHITLIPPNTTHQFTVLAQDAGQRLDLYLKQRLPSYSRNFLQQLILQNMVSINSKKDVKPRTITKSKDLVSVTFPPIPTKRMPQAVPDDLDIQIVHADKHFMVINKPPNLSVHPPRINSKDFTLIDWLAHSFTEMEYVGYADKPGIVHRLDKDTSGIMLVACNNCAHALLCDMFKKRTIQKTYLALVTGHPNKKGIIDFAIMRHPTKRTTMTHVTPGAQTNNTKVRDACTQYQVLEYFDDCSLVQIKPVTGRTHQIRVHFAAIGHALVGDYVYGKKSNIINRQALHAYKLSFKFNGKQYEFSQNPPKDFQNFIEILHNN